MEDQQIVELFWARSETALAELEGKYGSRALQLAQRFLGSRADAEECVNDALHALWARIPPERPAHLWAYFSRVVRNLCCDRMDHLHAAKRDRRCEVCLSELEGTLPAGQDMQQALQTGQITRVINAFLEAQTALDRIIFVRRYYYFDPCADIGRRVGLSRGAVNTRLSRMRQELKKRLEREEIFV